MGRKSFLTEQSAFRGTDIVIIDISKEDIDKLELGKIYQRMKKFGGFIIKKTVNDKFFIVSTKDALFSNAECKEYHVHYEIKEELEVALRDYYKFCIENGIFRQANEKYYLKYDYNEAEREFIVSNKIYDENGNAVNKKY